MSIVPVNLLGLDLDALVALCEELGEKRFRAVQLFRWIHQRGVSDFAQMTDLAKSFRAKLAELFEARDPLYREIADVVIDTSRQNVHTLVMRLLQRLDT